MWEGTPTLQLKVISEPKLSYKVLESILICKEGGVNSAITCPVVVTNDHLNGSCIKIRWGIIATCD